jgi:hypothetical protein
MKDLTVGPSFKLKNKRSSVLVDILKIKNKRCCIDQRINGQQTFQRTTDFSTYNGSCAQLWFIFNLNTV